jgi:hypothetical protein
VRKYGDGGHGCVVASLSGIRGVSLKSLSEEHSFNYLACHFNDLCSFSIIEI